MVFASVQGPEGRRENVQTESKTCRSLAEMTLSVVRKNPQEPAQTRGSRQKKANPEGKPLRNLVEDKISEGLAPKGWFFLYWWCNADLGSNSLSEQVRKD